MIRATLETLGRILDPRAKRMLRDWLSQPERSEALLAPAIKAVARQRDREALTVLRQLANRASPSTCLAIVSALCQIDGEAGYDMAMQIFDLLDEPWRHAAAGFMQMSLTEAEPSAADREREAIQRVLRHIKPWVVG